MLAEEAIQHVCFLSDVNKLYDNALGLYDLELTLMVAQQSQKVGVEQGPFVYGANCIIGPPGIFAIPTEASRDGSHTT